MQAEVGVVGKNRHMGPINDSYTIWKPLPSNPSMSSSSGLLYFIIWGISSFFIAVHILIATALIFIDRVILLPGLARTVLDFEGWSRPASEN